MITFKIIVVFNGELEMIYAFLQTVFFLTLMIFDFAHLILSQSYFVSVLSLGAVDVLVQEFVNFLVVFVVLARAYYLDVVSTFLLGKSHCIF